ncbi:MAG: glycosyltransferase family 4 protein [Hyphomicrobium sp.]|nr:glycosyltransferase family 4 protein [Hyphomicrobium sp.]
MSVVVCQIGAREHYVVAAEFARRGRLAALVTDIWVGEGGARQVASHAGGSLARRLGERSHPALQSERVLAPPLLSMLAHEAMMRLAGRTDWDAIMMRNARFGSWASRALMRSGILDRRPAVFAYSYAAGDIFRAAKRQGCRTVLGQIDPGPVEDEIVAEVARRNGIAMNVGRRPPPSYWTKWREEVELADVIVANSNWSAELLARAGVAADKIGVVPLAYVPSPCSPPRVRRGRAYSNDDPLRLLFLGQINVRKGALELASAMRLLKDVPVHLTLVGATSPDVAAAFDGLANAVCVPAVPRSETGAHYDAADVFILPTHSDGFGLTQIEAMARGLPVIASRCCGSVVEDFRSGRILTEVTADRIAEQIRWFVENPGELEGLSRAAVVRVGDFGAERVVDDFLRLVMGRAVYPVESSL